MVAERGADNRGKRAGEHSGEAVGSGSGAGGGGAPEDMDVDSAGGGTGNEMPRADVDRPDKGGDASSHGSR
jgi:hypothetical protein